MNPVEVARRAIKSGSVLRAAMDAVTALIGAGLLPAEAEPAAAPQVWQAIVEAQAGAETYAHINPAAAARAVVAVLEQHNLLTTPSTKETAA